MKSHQLKELEIIIVVFCLRQEKEDKCWSIISRPLKTPVTGIKIDSTAELFESDNFIIEKVTVSSR